MRTIEFSIAEHFGNPAQLMAQTLNSYSRKTAIHVVVMPWDNMWSDLVRIALYKDGPLVSEIGTTWLDAMVSMEALRPFHPAEISLLGGLAAYLPAAMQSGMAAGYSEVWGIPWLADTRVIYYWRDLLDHARVQEGEAFSSFDCMADALQRLRADGVTTPWAVATTNMRDVVYNIIPWVRAQHGDFITEDNQQLLIHQPAAVQGMAAYFDLYRFMPGWPEVLTGLAAVDLFRQRRVAAILCGPWLMRVMQATGELAPASITQLGIASPPGPAFVGGTDLVMWKHGTREEEALALELLRYLLTSDKALTFCQRIGLLPARLELLAHPFYADNPHLSQISKILKQGRPHPRIASWGLIEERLSKIFVLIQQELSANPEQDVTALLNSQIIPMAERLAVTLGTRKR